MKTLEESLSKIFNIGVLITENQLEDYAVDGCIPRMVVRPRTVEAMSQILSLASEYGSKVVPWGGGTQMGLGNPPTEVDLIVDTTRLDRILDYQPKDLTATVEAGITLDTFKQHLALNEQTVLLEAPQPHSATIGGILAANSSGPSRSSYGTAREWLIGVKVVHSDGRVTKSGGKVVKNVTGYDLNKLYVGSLGTLGIIAEATFKLAPIQPCKQALVATFASVGSALNASARLRNCNYSPNAVQVVSGNALIKLPQRYFPQDAKIAVVISFSGRLKAVERQIYETSRLMQRSEASEVENIPDPEATNLLQAIANLGWTGDDVPWLTLKLVLLPSHIEAIVGVLPALTQPLGDPGIVADVGFGSMQLFWWDTELLGEDTILSVQRTISNLRKSLISVHGTVVVERCASEVKSNISVWGDDPDGIEIMRRIKHELDPSCTFNTGRFIGGI